MLDADTKRRIDTARDILVGKVPDPKSQVEQITIALIYKFMHDMDVEAEELGGRRTFFADGFAHYDWSRLMRSGLGGHEMLGLYAEAITRMPENPGVPPLFRDIFNNAYLPYRDPETLREFLKVIDEFTYDHSERLGDAFEYLLSVLGSQGDAGQFRTPRHIIDFIVQIIDPKKDETVLDPACGTAGFLISSYKHILKANTLEDGTVQLSPDDRERLSRNFKGYDISPDMVRLSLVNMYLHGFTDPHISEYDTLTSQDNWNEYFDVILANPPFMSPKGGIRPHNRFTVQSKRSEVLFVDYIHEHLSANGRAGVIVPEGIIFQSQTAYKQLRKMLVEESLVAVISLPAGVFNPYSGVKTSILILDKALARQSDTIGFFKVDNDGFGLGAQRRPIDKNDLPQVTAEIQAYFRSGAGDAAAVMHTGLSVPRELVSLEGNYNLSIERYRTVAAKTSDYPLVRIGDVCQINPELATPEELYPASWFHYIDISCVENGTGSFLGANRINTVDAPSRARRLVRNGDVVLSTVRPNLKAFAILKEVPDRSVASTGFAVLRSKLSHVLPEFLIAMLRHDRAVDQMVGMMGKGAYPSINQSDVAAIEIPLPPLDVQKEIVAETEGYQKVIDGARAVVDNYRPHIPIHPDWPVVPIADLVGTERNSLKAGPFGSSLKKEYYAPSGYKIYGQEQVIRGDASFGDYYIDESKFRELESCKVQAGDVLISLVGTYGKTLIVPEGHEPGIINPRLLKLTLDPTKMLPEFFVHAFAQDSVVSQVDGMSHGGTMNILSLRILKELQLPCPSVDQQAEIIAEIEAEQRLVDANKMIIERFEKKIAATIARIWGDTDSGESV